MDTLVPKLYYEYGTYVCKSKMLPNSIDGLLPVQKRILLTTHLIAKSRFVKTAKILGENMARFHPHSASLGTAAWAVQNGFADGQGQWGSKIGTSIIGPAAERYTEMKANSFIEELAFKYVDYVKWEPDELDPEPKFLPTMIPFCLFSKSELSSIAFGFKTDIPCYKLKDLFKRLLYLQGKTDKITIKPFIEGCTITSGEKELEEILSTGKGKLDIKGKIKEDPDNFTVYIYGWSPRVKFETLLSKIDNYNKNNLFFNGDIAYLDESTDSIGTCVKFEVAKARNREDIYNKMAEAIKNSVKASLSYNIIVVDDKGVIAQTGVDHMLKTTFNVYKTVLTNYYNTAIIKIQDQIVELQIIEKIRPHISEALDKYKDGNMEKIIDFLSKKTSETKEDVNKVCEKYRIKRILTSSTDISLLEKEMKSMKKDVGNINKVTLEVYKTMADSCT